MNAETKRRNEIAQIAADAQRFGPIERHLPPGTKLPAYSGPSVEFIGEPTGEDRQRQLELLHTHYGLPAKR